MDRWTAVIAWGLVVAAGVLGGCGGPRVQTTRLTAVDLVAMTDKMAASLARADAVVDRTADDPQWRIAADRLVNRTHDIIPDREKELFLARLRALLSRSTLPEARNIVFLREAELSGPDRATPTHALTATFDAMTHDRRLRRSDAYLCAFQLIDLRDETVIWEDRYEVKRTVVRSRFD